MPEKVYLIDGTAFIHRAFHAIKMLRTSKGQATNALYGLTTMLLKFIKGIKPARCAVIFDSGEKTHRHQIYPQYKANRPPAPPDLASQFPIAERLVKAMGIPVLQVSGVEADDVIATLTRESLEKGFEVSIESGDKDMFQLVRKGVVVHDPMRDKTYDIEGVKEKLGGVYPEFVCDFLALVGDASDNVPGVAGIGEKGASEIVSEFGHLDDIYKNCDKLPPKKRDALLKGKESAYLSLQLVKLKDDIDLGINVEDLKLEPPKIKEIREILRDLEFLSLMDEFSETEDKVLVMKDQVDIKLIPADLSFQQLISVLASSPEIAVICTFYERNPTDPKIKLMGFATNPSEAFVITDPDIPVDFFRATGDILCGKSFFAVNYKEIYQLWKGRGVELCLPSNDPTLSAYVLNPERESQSIDILALNILNETLPPIDTPNGIGRRAMCTIQISKELEKRLLRAGLSELCNRTEIPLSRCLAEMEMRGIMVDRQTLKTVSGELGKEMDRLEKEAWKKAGQEFNLNSPKQLADILFNKLGFKVVKKTKTGPSTDSAVLEALEEDEVFSRNDLPRIILEYRSLAKLKSTYTDILPDLINTTTGRLHTSYNQTVTATGRLSSSDPNLQNIPIRSEIGKRIRSAFIAAPGYEFVSADYSQIELRVLAHLSQDNGLINAFMSGADIHARTASQIFHCEEKDVTPEQRRIAKTVNFGILYGMSAFRLGRDLKISTHDAAKIISEYFSIFPDVKRFLEATISFARENGFVKTLTGRSRVIEGINSTNHNERSAAERMALNTPIQGTAADIIKVAMVRLRERLRSEGLDAHMVLQVHDELVLEVNNDEGDDASKLLKEVMENAFDLVVPLKVDVGRGKTWADLHG